MNRYAWILTSFWPKQSKGMNRNKRDRYKSLILAIVKHEQLILAQGEDSKKGQLIYLTRKGSFQVILYKMIRFLSGNVKKHTKLAKIEFLLTDWSSLWTLTNFNRFSHPTTVTTPSVKRQIGSHWIQCDAHLDAWKWVWDRFLNVTMHSNGTLPLLLMLDAPLAARCGYSITNNGLTNNGYLKHFQ